MSLIDQNPWWRNPELIDSDKQILEYNESNIKWSPRIKHYFELESHLIYTLRGPRQVGKTTLMKLIISELLKKGVSPRRFFYYTCDLVESPSRLAKIIEQYLNSTEYITECTRYIFLDEVSAVPDWQRAIKHLSDLGRLENVTVIMTGSHSLDIRKAAERLPGRRGRASSSVLDKVLLPMKFSEYVDTRNKDLESVLLSHDIRKHETRKNIIVSLQRGVIPDTIKEISLYLGDLNRLFHDYLYTGGTPRAINDYVNDGRITEGTYSTYINVTIGDFLRWNKKEVYLAQLINRLNDTLSTQVSWKTLQNNTDIGSPNTVSEYVDVLKASYVVNPLYVIDRSKGRPNYGKRKKIHFTDPFIFHALRGWVRQVPCFEEAQRFNESDEKNKLVESVICDHLIRFAYSLHPVDNFEAANHLMYWKDSKSEVDFVLRYIDSYMPFEVKFVSSYGRNAINGMYNFTKSTTDYKGVVITRDLLAFDKGVVNIPASVFLLLI
jgi:predicted AAA+ superfamily ATPase